MRLKVASLACLMLAGCASPALPTDLETRESHVEALAEATKDRADQSHASAGPVTLEPTGAAAAQTHPAPVDTSPTGEPEAVPAEPAPAPATPAPAPQCTGVPDGASEGPRRLPEWQAPSDVLQATGSFLYMESDATDSVGLGQRFLYGSECFPFRTWMDQGRIHRFTASVWNIQLEPPAGRTQFEQGMLTDVRHARLGDGPGLIVYHQRGCAHTNVQGVIVVDAVQYDDAGALEGIEVRFEQHCGSSPAALLGHLRWAAEDVQALEPPEAEPAPRFTKDSYEYPSQASMDCHGEVQHVSGGRPRSLPEWQPPEGATPEGDYFLLDADPQYDLGYPEGRGAQRLYPAGCIERVTQHDRMTRFQLGLGWGPDLSIEHATGSIGLAHGTYSNVSSPAKAGPGPAAMHVHLPSRYCGHGQVDATFIVDDIAYDELGILEGITLRFEQRCQQQEGALFGKLQWGTTVLAAHPTQ